MSENVNGHKGELPKNQEPLLNFLCINEVVKEKKRLKGLSYKCIHI